MAYFAGLRGSGSFGTDERPKEFREMILWMEPNGAAPLFALTSKSKTEALSDPEFNWWEEVQTINRMQVNNGGGYTSGDLTITVNNGEPLRLIPGDILMVEPASESATFAPEYLRVVSTTSTTVVVTRGALGSTAAAIADDLWLFRVGNAQGEGTLSVATSSNNPTKFSNYTQIFKTPYELTNTAAAITYRTGDPLKNEQKRASFEHAEKIEQALFFGRESETTVTQDGKSVILRTTRGIRRFITSNNTVFGVRPSMSQLVDAIAPVFTYRAGSAGNERLAFCGNRALMTLASLAENSVHVQQDGHVKYYGMEFTKFILPQGTIYVKSHPLMNVHPVYEASMFILPGNGITYRPLKGRDTAIQKGIQPNDADYKKDQWLTECGFEFHFERTWAYLGGVR